MHTSWQVSWLADLRLTDAFPFPVAYMSVGSPVTVTSSLGIRTRFPFHRTHSARHPLVYSIVEGIIL